MNKIALILSLLYTLGTSQDISSMNEAQMQAMMQEMQKVQVCLSQLDMSALQNMQTEALHAQNDVKKLCESGQRDKAQKIAINFSKRMLHMHVLSELKGCVKDSAMASMMDINAQDFSKRHVCDDAKIDLGMPSQNRINW